MSAIEERSAKLAEIKARHEAATEGPYRWYGYVKGKGRDGDKGSKRRRCENLHLATINRGRIYVMRFQRSGFNDAEPVFQDQERHIIRGAGEFVTAFKTYSGEMTDGINNPDAIALERSWEDRQFLLDEIDRLRGLIHHAWIHGAYPDCGYDQMTTEQKALYDAVLRGFDVTRGASE